VTVQGIQWQTRTLSKKKTARVLVVSFSGALEPGPAQDLGDYHLASLGKAKKSGARASKPVALASAVYNPALDTVTLTPKGTVVNQTLELTITAAGTLDAEGRPIDGSRDGQPGGNLVATFGKGGISLSSTSDSSAATRVSAEAFDMLLVTGYLPTRRTQPGF